MTTGSTEDDLLALSGEEVLKRARRLARAGAFPGAPVRVALVSGFLTDYLADPLRLFLSRRGLAAELWCAPYGVLDAALLDEAGGLRQFGADLVVILPSHRDLAYDPAAEEGEAVAREAARWEAVWRRVGKPIVQLGFDPPAARPLGEHDAGTGLLGHVRRVNEALRRRAPGHVALVDAEWLAARVGFERWHDRRLYHMCKQPFAMDAMPALADALAGAAAAQFGKGRKVLVLDLDNTLWGGEIGDAGVGGIVLGPETPEGEAFVDFQRYCRALMGRGVVLAACSKNDDRIAREPFRSHGAMVLKEDDFACFVANFDDKATNIRRIAATLDLGIGSFVMVDDNPVERAWLRRELPELLVPELPDEPAGYVRALDELNPFAVLRLTAEDATRARSYRARAAVAEMRSNAANLDSFLASLEPVAVVEPVYAATLDRIAQIVAKTNQFKLNPTVYGTEEIRARAGDVIALRLKDRLQDYGIVAVAVSRLEGADLRIENWVMSCRVFSRRLEHVMRELLAERARAAGAAGLRARYEETPRNGLMKEVLTGLGFVPGPGDWVAPASVAVPPHHMRIEGVEAWRRGAA